VIELERSNGAIKLTVGDDGQGIPGRLEGETVGIEGMRERALLAGGTLAVDSQVGVGTTVKLSFPVECD
jgi:signal transduction histidine kinase